MSAALAVLVAAILSSPPTAEAEEHTVAGLVFEAPGDAEVVDKEEGPQHVRVVQVTHGEEVLVLAAYGGDDPPPIRRARTIHTEEVERMATREADRIETGSFRQRILGRRRSGREVRWTRDGGEEVLARVVAGRGKGHTVVATWMHPPDLEAPMSPGLVESLRLAGD
ncbi:MAG: hypothetical protein ACQEXJ_08030 [Myxococcota bacterium]